MPSDTTMIPEVARVALETILKNGFGHAIIAAGLAILQEPRGKWRFAGRLGRSRRRQPAAYVLA